MKKLFVLGISLFVLLLFFLLFTQISTNKRQKSVQTQGNPSAMRLISTVPSITEILFDISVGQQIVGDSIFTAYPPETEKIEKIGGLYDMNYEKIASLRPDLVFCLLENDTLRQRLKILGIQSESVDHRWLGGVLESYKIIGKHLGEDVYKKSIQKRDNLQQKLDILRNETKNLSPVRVMVCVDRSRDTGRLQGMYIAGNNPFYTEVIKLAGGENVAGNLSIPFANLSTEGIIDLAPDVIVELYTGQENQAAARLNENEIETLKKKYLAEWQTLGEIVPAVKNNRVYMITDDYATIPGPRTPLFIEKLAFLLHGKP